MSITHCAGRKKAWMLGSTKVPKDAWKSITRWPLAIATARSPSETPRTAV